MYKLSKTEAFSS